MENVSIKPKRGRPRSVAREVGEIGRRLGGEAKSDRSATNFGYFVIAMDALDLRSLVDGTVKKVDHPYGWFDRGKGECQPRQTILTELGRIENQDELRAIAELICRQQMRTREAIAMIRQFRLGEGTASALDLTIRILSSINDYILQHPSTTLTQVRAALENATNEWAETTEDRGEP